MLLNRRKFLRMTPAGMLAGVTARSTSEAPRRRPSRPSPSTDFAIFDARPIFALAEDFFPGRGAELSSAWRTRQFEYTWQRTLIGRYRDFWHVTEDALIFSARLLKLELSMQKRAQLMYAYRHQGVARCAAHPGIAEGRRYPPRVPRQSDYGNDECRRAQLRPGEPVRAAPEHRSRAGVQAGSTCVSNGCPCFRLTPR